MLTVPRGYEIPFPYEITNDVRFEGKTVNYPKLQITLRKTQQEALDAYLAERENALRENRNVNGVIVIPTGKGKSILGLAIAAKLKKRTLVIVWKDDLVDGWMQDAYVSLKLTPRNIGLIKAKTFRLGERITLTTIQTLSKLPEEKIQELREYFGLVMVDEFHHSASKIYEIANTFPAIDRLGLTATDMRNDKLDPVLNFYFGNTCYRFLEDDEDEDIISAKNVDVVVRESDIVYNPPTMYIWTDGKNRGLIGDLSVGQNDNRRTVKCQSPAWKEEVLELVQQGKAKRKPLNPHEIYDVIDQDVNFNKMVASDVLHEYKQGKSCLVFCKEKEHVRLLEELINRAGVPKEQIQLYYGDMKGKNAKKDMKRKAEDREVLVTIATYSIATEGTNVKAWEVCFLAMTFNNPISTIQAVGRIRRQCKGKTKAKVYDYSHPKILGAKNHLFTRMKVYRELGFNIIWNRQKGFNFVPITRGYKN